MPSSIRRARLRWCVLGLVLSIGILATPSYGLAQTAPADAPTPTPAPSETPTPTGSLADTSTPTVTVAPAATPAAAAPSLSVVDPNLIGDVGGGGGPRNLVKVQNVQDNQLRVDGHVQLGRIPGPMVAPVNAAESYSSCTGCQTLAVALQVDLITPDTQQATPKNMAFAVNYQCTDCHTIALALQCVLTVDDPTQVPDTANQLMAEMRQELNQMHGDQSLTLPDAEARVMDVVNQFQDLVVSLDQQRDESTEPTTANASPPTQ
jgi:putative peptide zinc metalloprotease protein